MTKNYSLLLLAFLLCALFAALPSLAQADNSATQICYYDNTSSKIYYNYWRKIHGYPSGGLYGGGEKPKYQGHHKLNNRQMAKLLSTWKGECVGAIDRDIKLLAVTSNGDTLSIPLHLQLVFPDDFSIELPFTSDLFDAKTGETIGCIRGKLTDPGIGDEVVSSWNIDAKVRLFRLPTARGKSKMTTTTEDVLVGLLNHYANIGEARKDNPAAMGTDASAIDATMLPPASSPAR